MGVQQLWFRDAAWGSKIWAVKSLGFVGQWSGINRVEGLRFKKSCVALGFRASRV